MDNLFEGGTMDYKKKLRQFFTYPVRRPLDFLKSDINPGTKLLALLTYPIWRPLDFMKSIIELRMRKWYITEVSIFFSVLSGVFLGAFISTDLPYNFKWVIISLIASLFPSGYLWVGTRWWIFKCAPKVWLRLFLDIIMAGIVSVYILIFYIIARGILGVAFLGSSFNLEEWFEIIYSYNAIFCVVMVSWFYVTAMSDKWVLAYSEQAIENVGEDRKELFQRNYEEEKENLIEEVVQQRIKGDIAKYPIVAAVSAVFYLVDVFVGRSLWLFIMYCFILLVSWYLVIDMLEERISRLILKDVFVK
jgi:hypothetical protein